jgi:hypothetical protein
MDILISHLPTTNFAASFARGSRPIVRMRRLRLLKTPIAVKSLEF